MYLGFFYVILSINKFFEHNNKKLISVIVYGVGHYGGITELE